MLSSRRNRGQRSTTLGVVFTALAVFANLLNLTFAGGNPTDTITSGGDSSRSGYQPNHNMDPAIVGSPQFGVLWRQKLKGNYRGWTEQIYAQALVYTPADKQYVYISTQMNWVYKLDAKTGEILASRNLHIPFLVSELDDCNDISFCVGNTATGVIDSTTDTWYLTTKTYRDQTDQEKGRMNGRYYFHALDVETLEERPNFPINFEGLIARNNPIRMFQGGIHHQRPALHQSGPYIYAGFASHCVQYNFTGWIIGVHGTTGQVVERFATEGGPEDKKGGGVWMSGGGLSSDNPKRLFFATGNGYASQLHDIPVPGRQPPTALEEAAVHMAIQDDGSLEVIDFFMPWEKEQLDGADKDLGTSGIALLDPNYFTGSKVARMGTIAGKSGKLYFLNMDDLGGYQMGPNKKDAVPQWFQLKNSVFATAGVYPLEGGYVYVNVVQHESVVFKWGVDSNGNPDFRLVAETPEKTAYILGVGHGTTTSLNNEPGTGIYWVTDIQGLNLRAYKAVPENGVLVLIKGLDIPGQMKFSRPTFGDGRVYLTTSTGDIVCAGSPVNLPFDCPSLVTFGTVAMGNGTSATREITCKALISAQINGIGARQGKSWRVADLPTLPLTITTGQNVTFKAIFTPSEAGPVSDTVYLNTTNAVGGYSINTPISVKGDGISATPLLLISPNQITFEGVVIGTEETSTNQTFAFRNLGAAPLIITKLQLSTESESGPYLPDGTTEVGPIKLYNVPTTIPALSEVDVTVNFSPTEAGSYPLYIVVTSNGGAPKKITVVASAGTHAKAKIEFEKADGSGWVEYVPNGTFSFGDVYQAKTKFLNLRVSNAASNTSEVLTITVSKPPVGAGKVVGAVNQIDLGEGTQLGGGGSATARLYCSVPRSQPNVDPYISTSVWTMNTNDPSMGKQDIRFSCRAVSEQVGPLKSDGQAKYRFVGCFKENNPGRQLETQLYGNDALTNGMCTTDCANNPRNFIFAGTQYHRECWCGNKIPTLKVDEKSCDYTCSGDETQFCGGNGDTSGIPGAYISLFADDTRWDGNTTLPTPTSTTSTSTTSQPSQPTTPPGGPVHNPGNDVYSLLGCYKEPTTGRALSSLKGDDALTVQTCFAFCGDAAYCGMEYSRECWSGNTLNPAAIQAPLSECSMTCAGNSTSEYCGAGGRLNLYIKRSLISTSSSATLSTTSSFPTTSASNSSMSTSTTASETTSDSSFPTITATNSSAPVTSTSATSVESSDTATATSTGTESSNTATATSTEELSASGGSNPTEAGTNTRNSSSSATSTSATSSATPSPWTHLGCANETTPRALNGGSISGSMTVKKCQDFCLERDLPLAGLEYGNECYCGLALQNGSKLNQTGCTTSCTGNSSQTCGGPSRLSVYNYTLYVPPSIVAAVGTYISQGCYSEGTGERALKGYAFSNSTGMTVEMCVQACKGRNFAYSGVEYAQECYCDNRLAATSNRLEDSRCGMLCKGNKREYCGGSGALLLYKNQPSNITSAGLPAAVDDIETKKKREI